MKPIHIFIGIVVAVLVAGFGFQSFITMNDRETKAETIERMVREADSTSGRTKPTSSPTDLGEPQNGKMSLPMEDGVLPD